MKVTALAGGVGGAKLSRGLASVLPAWDLTIVVNTGDDFDLHGLRICPDLDTVVYTLGGVANRKTGWGRANETWSFLETIELLGAPTWFQLGDRDLAVHVFRTERLRAGARLSQVTAEVGRGLGLASTVLPMTDDDVRTIVRTDEGDLEFQRYFVQRACEPRVRGFLFDGVERARPAPGVLEAINASDLIVLCPSNPWVSLDPILAVPGIRDAVAHRPAVAVSPFIGGKAVKGPAAKMAAELGLQTTPGAVAGHYSGVIRGLVYDSADLDSAGDLSAAGLQSFRTRTLMRSDRDRRRLAEEVLAFAGVLVGETAP